jgi:hypothetical protein
VLSFLSLSLSLSLSPPPLSCPPHNTARLNCCAAIHICCKPCRLLLSPCFLLLVCLCVLHTVYSCRS